jgi:hypothetical protein
MTQNTHAWFAYPTFYLVTFITFLGMLSSTLMARCSWNTKFILRIKLFHKIISYLLILCGNVACFTGIWLYRTDPTQMHPSDTALEWINIGLIIFLMFTAETLY